jgi:hypothetical protein
MLQKVIQITLSQYVRSKVFAARQALLVPVLIV